MASSGPKQTMDGGIERYLNDVFPPQIPHCTSGLVGAGVRDDRLEPNMLTL